MMKMTMIQTLALKLSAFKQVAVRDLAWVMLSPGLMEASTDACHLVSDDWCQQAYVTHEQDLYRLDENPEPLNRYLAAQKSHRLGFYFEMLLAYWLERILQSHLFSMNVPVYQARNANGRQTLGEFDFLFAHQDRPILQHWEATVKFYLYYQTEAGDARWLGPASQDRLDLKLRRMFEHQLRLAETAEGTAVTERFSALAVNASAFIKGYLFYPLDRETELRPEHTGASPHAAFAISPAHLRGWWLRQGEIMLPKRCADSRWQVLSKLGWLSPACCADATSASLLSDAEAEQYCAQHFLHHRSALLLAELRPGADGWLEVARGFVVAADWPDADRSTG